MMFFNKGKNPSDSPKPAKKRSLFGLLFVPQLGPSIRPIGGAFSLLVNIIASVFAMNGLFPKDHPALNGDANARLSLSSVLSTAWNGLSFTPEGMPKVLLFFAVSAGIALIFLSVVTALLLGLTSSAHAESFFTPGPSDMASNWLDVLFNVNEYGNARDRIVQEVGQYVLPSSNIQAAFTRALAVYSNAMLMIAAIMLFYHLTAMVVETAHHGEPMGKRANKIWAPIRLVFAVGLLVPVSDGGLNSGQYIVLKVAKMGCGLASTIWEGFVDAMMADMQGLAGGNSLSSISTYQETKTIAYNLLMMYACQYAFNYQVYAAEKLGQMQFEADYVNARGTWHPQINYSGKEGQTSPGKYSFKSDVISDYDVCGSYTIPKKPEPSESSLDAIFSKAHTDVVSSFSNVVLPIAAERATYIGKNMKINADVVNGLSMPAVQPSPDDVAIIAEELRRGLGKATVGVNTSDAVGNLATKIGEKSKKMGWVAAGSWFNSLVTVQSDISGVIDQSMPSVNPPQIGEEGGPSEFEGWFGRSKRADEQYEATKTALQNYSKLLTEGEPGVAAQSLSGSTINEDASSLPTSGSYSPVGMLLALVGKIASIQGIWQQSEGGGGANGATLTSQNIGVQFRGNNPLLEMSAWGHKCVGAALTYFNTAAWISLASGGVNGFFSIVPPIGFFGKLLKALAGIALAIAGGLILFGSIFFGMGVTLGYVVPLLPFMHFFFGTITWAACVAEALIAVPLIALAHLSPEGDGISGKAQGAYEMVFSIFLRPVMMIFGLVCCLLVMYVAIGLLNALYATAISGPGTVETDGTHMVIGRVIFSVIYVALIYSVANHATALISRFPNQAVTWAGWKPATGETMGSPSQIAAATGAASGWLGQQAGNAANKLASAVGEKAGVAGGKVKGNLDDAIAKKSEVAHQAGKENKAMPAISGIAGRLGRDKISSSYTSGLAAGELEMFKRVEKGASSRGMSVRDYVSSSNPDIMTEVADANGGNPVMNSEAFMQNYLAKAHLIKDGDGGKA